MKCKLFFLLVLCFPLLLNAQGIRWTENLSWVQIKQKAKDENKYVFMDCFATWCGPCKKMDREVYINDSVGQVMNEKFINVKVQFDKTDADNEKIKSWYEDVESIQKSYHLAGFPSFLFFDPEGNWSLETKDIVT